MRKIEAGGTITIRLPVNTPPRLIDYLNDLRQQCETEGTWFSTEATRIFLEGCQQRQDGAPSATNPPVWLTRLLQAWEEQRTQEAVETVPPAPAAPASFQINAGYHSHLAQGLLDDDEDDE